MRIIQITDSHIAHDIPTRQQDLQNCISAVNALTPDLVIHTGDITHNGLPEEVTTARQCLDKLIAPYCVLIGNKDIRATVIKEFQDHEYLSNPSNRHSGFLQYSLEQFKVRLIMLDTVLELTSKGELCNSRLQHLDDMLAKDTGKPAVIFMHHSPFVVEEIPDPHQFHNWQDVDNFAAVLSRYSNIDNIYCGHVHRNVEGAIGKLPVHVLTCMATDLRRGKLSDKDKTRPMYRVIDLVD